MRAMGVLLLGMATPALLLGGMLQAEGGDGAGLLAIGAALAAAGIGLIWKTRRR